MLDDSYLTTPRGFLKALEKTKHETLTPANVDQQQNKKSYHFSPTPGKNPAARDFIKACQRATGLPTTPSAPCQLRSTSASDIAYEVQQAAGTTILPSKPKLL